MRSTRGSTGATLATFPFIAAFPALQWCPAVAAALFSLSLVIVLGTFAPYIPGLRQLPFPLGALKPTLKIETARGVPHPPGAMALHVTVTTPRGFEANVAVTVPDSMRIVLADPSTGRPLHGKGTVWPPEDGEIMWTDGRFLRKGATVIGFLLTLPDPPHETPFPFFVKAQVEGDDVLQVKLGMQFTATPQERQD